MTAYVTGRTRTLVISGVFSGAFTAKWGFVFGLTPALERLEGNFGVSGNDFAITGSVVNDIDLPSPGVKGTFTLTARIATDAPVTDVVVTRANAPTTITFDLTGGTWSATYHATEFVEFTEGAWDGFQAPERTTFRIYEKMLAGETLTVTASVAGATVTATKVLAVDLDIAYEASGGFTAIADLHGSGGIGTSLALTGTTYGGSYSKSFTYGTATVGGGVSVTASSGDGNPHTSYCTASLSPIKAYTLSGVVRAWDVAYPETLGLAIDRFGENAAGDLGGMSPVDAAGGAFSDSYNQDKYSAIAEFDGTLQTPVDVNEWCNLTIYARAGSVGDGDTHSLLALGEDVRNTRVLMRGHHFKTFDVVQNSATTVDDGSSLTPAAQPYAGEWSGVSHASLSLSSGVRIEASGGTGKAQRTFTPRLGGFSGYSLLKVWVTADADGSPFSVSISSPSGTKRWTADYTGAALTANMAAGGFVLLNLCSPSSETATTDDTDTKWPLPSTDGPLSGVTSADTLTLDGLMNGRIYTVAKIELVKWPGVTPNSRITFLEPYDNWVLEVPPVTAGDVTTTTYASLGMDGDTDGRRSLEELCARKEVVSSPSGTTITYSHVPLSAWYDMLGHNAGNPANQPNPVHAGWTSSNPAGTTDPAAGGSFTDWLNNNRPSVWAWGGGVTFRAGATNYGINRTADSLTTVYAQTLFDTLDWYPGCGDVMNVGDGSSTGPVQVRAAYWLRGQSFGIVLGEGGAPASSVTVKLQLHSNHSAAGNGTTDVRGLYGTGTAFGKGLKEYDTIAETTAPYPKITRTFFSRKRHRACFRVISRTGNPFNFADRQNLTNYHATAIVARKAVYSRSIFQSLAGGWDVEQATVAEADPDHAISDLRTARLILQTMAASFCLSLADGTEANTWRAISNDDGSSWSDPVLMIERGQRPTVAVGNDGAFQVEAYAAYVDNVDDAGVSLGTGGTIVARRRTCGDIDFGDEFTFVDNSGDPINVILDSFHIQQSPDGSGRWMLHCNEFGATDTSHWESYDDLTSFIRVS